MTYSSRHKATREYYESVTRSSMCVVQVVEKGTMVFKVLFETRHNFGLCVYELQ